MTSYSLHRCTGTVEFQTTYMGVSEWCEIKLTWILECPNSCVDLSKVFRHLLKKHAYLLPAILSRNMSGCVTCYAGVYVTGLSKSSSTSLPSVQDNSVGFLSKLSQVRCTLVASWNRGCASTLSSFKKRYCLPRSCSLTWWGEKPSSESYSPVQSSLMSATVNCRQCNLIMFMKIACWRGVNCEVWIWLSRLSWICPDCGYAAISNLTRL